MQPQTFFTRLSRRTPESTFPIGSHSGIVEGKATFLPYAARQDYPCEFRADTPDMVLTFQDVKDGRATPEELVMQRSPEELARLLICNSAGWGMEGTGEAGSIYPLEGAGLPRFSMADGNS